MNVFFVCFLVAFFVFAGVFFVKEGLNGKNGGCGLLLAFAIIFVVLWFIVQSCEQYEEDWGEHGRFTPKQEQISSSTVPVSFKPTATSGGVYYPTYEMDRHNPDNIPSSGNKFWDEGFEKGFRDGFFDFSNKTPYKSYKFTSNYQRGKDASFKWGYWIGYSSSYKNLKRLSSIEVQELIENRKNLQGNDADKPTSSEKKQSDDFHQGYQKGYQDGEDDGVEDLDYRTSYDANSTYSVSDDYINGYKAGYEAGYNDYKE